MKNEPKNQETDQRELSAAKSKASAHKLARLPAGFSGQHTYKNLKNRRLEKK